jgi:CheY-like chemotaxis protein
VWQGRDGAEGLLRTSDEESLVTTGLVTPCDAVRDAAAARLAHAAGRVPHAAVDRTPGSEADRVGHAISSPQSRPSRLPSSLGGLRVVVVDDDPDTVDLFAAVLTACGAAVTTASAAADALRLVAESRPDVVLSDIAMPHGDGYWLVGEIRRLPEEALRSIPVIAATAFGREHPRERVMAAGFADHLRKPIDPEALCRAIARAAGR